jgi:hypothetical protein
MRIYTDPAEAARYADLAQEQLQREIRHSVETTDPARRDEHLDFADWFAEFAADHR